MWQSKIYYGSLFSQREPRSEWQCEIFREGPGTETQAPSDVMQLQCWNNAHRTLFLRPALILISKVMKQRRKFRFTEKFPEKLNPKISYLVHLVRLFDAFMMQIPHRD